MSQLGGNVGFDHIIKPTSDLTASNPRSALSAASGATSGLSGGAAGGGSWVIGGDLPFPNPGNPLAGAGTALGMPGLDQLANQYGQSYQAALQQNQAMYNNILKGYQQLMGSQQAAQQPIMQGYTDLQNQVLGDIANVGGAQKQSIKDVYAQRSGALGQSLVSRGLGNTTVTDSLQRGLGLDEEKAQVALADQMAQLRAGYRSNLGLAGLNYQNQAAMQNSALGQNQLNWMNSVTARYPNAQDYHTLFAQAGQGQQAAANQALQRQLFGAGGVGGFGNRGTGGGASGAGQGGGVKVAQMPGVRWGGLFGPGSNPGGGGAGGYGGYGGQNMLTQSGGTPQSLNFGGGAADYQAQLDDVYGGYPGAFQDYLDYGDGSGQGGQGADQYQQMLDQQYGGYPGAFNDYLGGGDSTFLGDGGFGSFDDYGDNYGDIFAGAWDDGGYY